jgi:hypothetical protein
VPLMSAIMKLLSSNCYYIPSCCVDLTAQKDEDDDPNDNGIVHGMEEEEGRRKRSWPGRLEGGKG